MDGNDTINELAKRALELGFNEIAITDHFECTNADSECVAYNPEKYFSELMKAKSKYKALKIKRGIELGQPHLFDKSVKKVLSKYKYDYVIGSVHTVPVNGQEVDFGRSKFTNDNLRDYVDAYFEHMEYLVQWNDYDCIGHLDLPKRYAANFGIRIPEAYYIERVGNILKKIIENGKGIEINTSGWRQAPKDCFPTFNIIKMYRDFGGYIITVGSDSHRKEDLGKGIKSAVELARYAGFKYLTTFEDRKPVLNLLRKIA
jgi:histidinol-phosphatase (PHP family)